ncbi:MAG: PQQ-binding-like beta-propeller repeat protein [Methanotrichaceae archaeon]|nr:PQQ-binding-like beta-propeller repeat protein [Methanotrichaceae archaeon]
MLIICLAWASDWPSFQGDRANSGLTWDGPPAYPQVLWSADLNRIDVTPIVSSNLVCVLAGNGTLVAMDKRTGDATWSTQMDGWVFQTSTPACSGDRIYAATDSGYLAAFDAKTGEEIWSHHLTDKRFEVPITCSDGRVYLGEGSAYGTAAKRYFCFDIDGNECWKLTRDTSGYMWCGASIAGDHLIFGDNDGQLLSVDRKTGLLADVLDLSDASRIDFARTDAGRIRASVSYKDGYVYTTSECTAEVGYAWKIRLNETTGTFENGGWSSPVGFSTSTPAVFGSRVYLGIGEHGHPGALACINDSNGDLIWSYPVEAGVKSSPAISAVYPNPRIIFTAAKVDGSAYCVEDAGSEARLLWHFDPPDDGYILAGAAVSDGRVYFGTEKGLLYCLSAEARLGQSTNATFQTATQRPRSSAMQTKMDGGS